MHRNATRALDLCGCELLWCYATGVQIMDRDETGLEAGKPETVLQNAVALPQQPPRGRSGDLG